MLQINIFLDKGSKCCLIMNIPRLAKSQKYYLAIAAGNLQLGKSLEVEFLAASPLGSMRDTDPGEHRLWNWCDLNMEMGITKFGN